MAIFRDGWNAIRHLLIVILDKIEPDKDAVYLFCERRSLSDTITMSFLDGWRSAAVFCITSPASNRAEASLLSLNE